MNFEEDKFYRKDGDKFVEIDPQTLDPNKRYRMEGRVFYEMSDAEVEEHLAAHPPYVPPSDPVKDCDAFLKANLPVEYRVQLGPSVSQALLHYQYGDYEAFAYLMDRLEEQVPESLVPVVKQCRGFFGL